LSRTNIYAVVEGPLIAEQKERAMVELKVRKFGRSLGIILPKEVIRRLDTGEGERLFLVETRDRDYLLTSQDPSEERGRREKMVKAEKIIARYSNTLRTLAK
jgi:antitoxin component of MazEF toxin-antitoxin module